MTKVLPIGARHREGERAPGAPRRPQSLTARERSRRLPRHEEVLSADEGKETPHPWLLAAYQVAGRQERPEAPPGEGPEAADAERSQEVGDPSGVRFGKGARLRRRREFLVVQERGRKVHAGAYVVLAIANDLGRPRLGVTVSTRVGNAVTRNRVKRWVREAFRASAPELPAMDLVVIARSGAPREGLPGAVRALAAVRGQGGG